MYFSVAARKRLNAATAVPFIATVDAAVPRVASICGGEPPPSAAVVPAAFSSSAIRPPPVSPSPQSAKSTGEVSGVIFPVYLSIPIFFLLTLAFSRGRAFKKPCSRFPRHPVVRGWELGIKKKTATARPASGGGTSCPRPAMGTEGRSRRPPALHKAL